MVCLEQALAGPEYLSQTATRRTDGTGRVRPCDRLPLKPPGTDAGQIGRQALSASSDCEAVYVGPDHGFGRTWIEKRANPAFLHLGDRPHRRGAGVTSGQGRGTARARGWVIFSTGYEKITTISAAGGCRLP